MKDNCGGITRESYAWLLEGWKSQIGISDKTKLLVYGLPIGTEVWWRDLMGFPCKGILEEWDNGTAIIRMNDGSTKTVRSEK